MNSANALNDCSASVLPMGKTARILRSSLTFGRKILSASVARIEVTELPTIGCGCRFQWFIQRKVHCRKAMAVASHDLISCVKVG